MRAVLNREHSRAVVGLGLGAVACCLFRFTKGDNFRLIEVDNRTVLVLLILGAAAIVSGVARNALLSAAAGMAFLLAAVVVIVQLGGRSHLLGGNATTFALYLGLGVGLVAIAATALGSPRDAGSAARSMNEAR